MKKALAISTLVAFGAVSLMVGRSQGNTITIGGYDGPTDTALVNELITKFVKPQLAKDGVDVKYQPTADYGKTILNQLSAGTAPDVFYLEDFAAQGLISTGRIMPLDGQVELGDFLPFPIFKQGGKTYGVAKDFNTLTLYYNKDLFDQAKIAYPNDKDTWNVFADKITKVQAALGKGFYGTCFPAEYSRFGAFAASTGWKPFTQGTNRTVLDARFKEAFSWYTGLVRKGVAAQPSQVNGGWGGDCIKSGKVATAFEGAWALGFLRDQAPNLKYGTSMLPRHPKTGKAGNLIYTVAWSINNATKNKDAAVKVLRALTSTEAQQFVLRGGLALPSRKALQNDPYFKQTTPEAIANRNVFAGATTGYANNFAPSSYGGDWFKPIDEALKSVMDGQSDVDEAFERARVALVKLTNKK